MKTLMNRFLSVLFVLGATLSITACQPGPAEPNDDGGVDTPPVSTELNVKFVNMLHMPFEVTSVDKVNVSAKITVSNGSLTEALLNYTVSEGLIQGEPQSVKMENSGVGHYNADIPAQPGKAVVKYWIVAQGVKTQDGESFEWESDFGNYIVAEDANQGGEGDEGDEGDTPPVVVEDPCKKVRLNEISTGASLGEFIEIYNTGAEDVNLDGVAIYKNLDYEEPLIVLKDVVLPAGGYGVLLAKATTATLPEGCINLGTTDRGLASSRALCVELGRDAGATIYDVYTNTINPNTDATDWNTDGVEFEAKFFGRFTDGWYSAGILTPGEQNLEPVTKLKHQKNAALAVSDAPYVASVGFDPTSITTGKSLTVKAEVYTDAYSSITKVECSVGGSTITLTKGEGDNIYTGTHTFSTEGNYTATVTASNNDNRKGVLSQGVTVLPAGTEFASQAAVRLNEINPDRKYIELYNTSSKPVNLIGMYIEKNNEDILLHIKDNIIIEGNQYAVLACASKDYSSNEYLYLGSTEKGLSGKKSLCIEWMATIPEKVRIDAFCNTKDTDPRPKVTVWDDESGCEAIISSSSAGRYPDGQVVNPQYPDKLPNEWLIYESSTLGYSNKSAKRTGRLRNQMTTIAPVPTE
ncbi:MAG: lamin tail domain-containing protein [Rikenellaceae bacterium]|nr:lamin tail domain-containing protein [Rikenellaceae bacterium]